MQSNGDQETVAIVRKNQLMFVMQQMQQKEQAVAGKLT